MCFIRINLAFKKVHWRTDSTYIYKFPLVIDQNLCLVKIFSLHLSSFALKVALK